MKTLNLWINIFIDLHFPGKENTYHAHGQVELDCEKLQFYQKPFIDLKQYQSKFLSYSSQKQKLYLKIHMKFHKTPIAKVI